MSSTFITLESEEQWGEILEKSVENKTAIFVDFTATWCGPCQRIGPYFHGKSEEYKESIFVKIDVDKFSELVSSSGVECMPTFKVFIDKEVKDTMIGANFLKLDQFIEQYSDCSSYYSSETIEQEEVDEDKTVETLE
tara:strand:+ start:272 stop:682 length:411 start_codon:yes stop_codon:yes gene_type:complete